MQYTNGTPHLCSSGNLSLSVFVNVHYITYYNNYTFGTNKTPRNKDASTNNARPNNAAWTS